MNVHHSAHMITEADIAELIRQLAAARGWQVSHASRMASGSGDTVERIDGGVGLTIRRANSIILKCAALWPDGHSWPKRIPRPKAHDMKRAS